MAKSLGIRPPSGQNNPDPVDAEVLQPITPSGTLGMIVAGILAASAAAARAIVDVDARRVYATGSAESQGDDASALSLKTGATLVGTLSRDEDARSAPWHRVGSAGYTLNNPAGMTALETLVAKPEKLAFNISSLVGRIEDAITAKDKPTGATDVLGIGSASAFIVVDQNDNDGRVSVVKVAAANVAAFRADLADGSNEIQFEQIPAEEAAGEATLPFE